MTKQWLMVVFLYFLAPILYAANADDFQQQVVKFAEDYLTEKAHRAKADMGASRIKVSVTPPSSHLALQACQVAPTVEDNSRETIGDQRLKLNCYSETSGQRWSVFLRGEIAVFRPVLVATQPLARGVSIPASAVSLKQKNLAELKRGYLTHIRELGHQVTRKRIRTGEALQPDMLEAAKLVDRGDRVVIRAGVGGVAVSVKGEALQSGSLHDQVRVRNLVSNKIVYGIVTGRGQVTVKHTTR